MSELDTAELLEEHNGKLYLPGYLDTIFTPDEKRTLQEMTHINQGPTVQDYPRAAAFLIEHDHKIHGHIPEEVFQELHETNYRRYLASHMGITSDKTMMIAWDLLSSSIASLNLAKLVPVLKFINNEWSTGDKMKKFFHTNPRCPMCDMDETIEHVFSCNSDRAKKTRTESIRSIKVVLARRNEDFAHWWSSIINACFRSLGAHHIEEYPLSEQDLGVIQSQLRIGPMNFFQGSIHKSTHSAPPLENGRYDLENAKSSLTRHHKGRTQLKKQRGARPQDSTKRFGPPA